MSHEAAVLTEGLHNLVDSDVLMASNAADAAKDAATRDDHPKE